MIHIKCTVLPVFFYRENTGCIIKCNIFLFFKQITKKIQVIFLPFCIIFEDSENAVPFIYYKYKKVVLGDAGQLPRLLTDLHDEISA